MLKRVYGSVEIIEHCHSFSCILLLGLIGMLLAFALGVKWNLASRKLCQAININCSWHNTSITLHSNKK